MVCLARQQQELELRLHCEAPKRQDLTKDDMRLQPIVCCFSALWLLAAARSCTHATNLFSSMSVTDATGESAGPAARIFGELSEGKDAPACVFEKAKEPE